MPHIETMTLAELRQSLTAQIYVESVAPGNVAVSVTVAGGRAQSINLAAGDTLTLNPWSQ